MACFISLIFVTGHGNGLTRVEVKHKLQAPGPLSGCRQRQARGRQHQHMQPAPTLVEYPLHQCEQFLSGSIPIGLTRLPGRHPRLHQ